MAETCRICGNDSYGWNLCRNCNKLRKQGKIVHTRKGWAPVSSGQIIVPDMVYSKRSNLITHNERRYFYAIQRILAELFPNEKLFVFPQVGLSALIDRNGDRSQSELFRVIDFVVTDKEFRPLIAIEVNDENDVFC